MRRFLIVGSLLCLTYCTEKTGPAGPVDDPKDSVKAELRLCKILNKIYVSEKTVITGTFTDSAALNPDKTCPMPRSNGGSTTMCYWTYNTEELRPAKYEFLMQDSTLFAVTKTEYESTAIGDSAKACK